MKLLHTADLHIGGAFSGFSPKDAADMRRSGVLGLGKLADYAKNNGIKHFLIAGDLFDTSFPSMDMRNSVLSVFNEHKDLSFYILSGNHDADIPLELKMRLPGNVFLAEEGFTSYDLGENVTLYSSGNEIPTIDGLNLDESKTNIVMLHAAPSARFARCEADIRAFDSLPLDYLALGHYHSYSSGKCGRGEFVMPGTPFARGFDDFGEKGFVVFDTESKTHGFIKTDGARFFSFEYRLDGEATDITKISGFIAEKGVKKGDYVRLTLTGKTDALRTDCDFLGERLSGNSGCSVTVRDKTGLPENAFSSFSLYSEFRNLVLADAELSDEDKNEILRYGYSALSGENVDSL